MAQPWVTVEKPIQSERYRKSLFIRRRLQLIQSYSEWSCEIWLRTNDAFAKAECLADKYNLEAATKIFLDVEGKLCSVVVSAAQVAHNGAGREFSNSLQKDRSANGMRVVCCTRFSRKFTELPAMPHLLN
jgi:hypothetical protein